MNLKNTLEQVFQKLNGFIEDYNSRCEEEGGLRIKKQTLLIVGQMALFLADLPFPITATTDLDINSELKDNVRNKLREELTPLGISLDPDGRKIWMPERTRHHIFFDSPCLQVRFADPEDVLLSKYKFNRPDDQRLIKTYLEYYPGFEQVIKNSGIKRK